MNLLDKVAVALGDGFLSGWRGLAASMASAIAKKQGVGRAGLDLVVALVHAGDESLAGRPDRGSVSTSSDCQRCASAGDSGVGWCGFAANDRPHGN